MRKKKEPKLNEELELATEDLALDEIDSHELELEASTLIEDEADEEITEVLEPAKPSRPVKKVSVRAPKKEKAPVELPPPPDKAGTEIPDARVEKLAVTPVETEARLNSKQMESMQQISQSLTDNLERIAKTLQAIPESARPLAARPSVAAKLAFAASAFALVLSGVSLSLAQSARQDALGQSVALARGAAARSANKPVAPEPAVELAVAPARPPEPPVAPKAAPKKELAKKAEDKKSVYPVDNPKSDDIAKVIESVTRKHRPNRGKKEVR